MAYVDLNPIRAKMAETPKESKHTSLKKRIDALTHENDQPHTLAKFIGNPREPLPIGLPFNLKDYIELVELTGKAIREDKRGHIDNNLSPILDRLDISTNLMVYSS